MRTPVALGVVAGLEAGRRVARTFEDLPQAEVRWVCGERIRVRGEIGRRGVRQTSAYANLLADESLDAVVLAVPVAVRYELALAALQADKHVYVAGVTAAKSEHARTLAAEARRRGRRLVGAHPCVFDPAVRMLKALVEAGRLGEVFYLRGKRNALGAATGAADLLWSVAADDVALVLHLVGDEPVDVAASGESFLDGESPDVLDCRLAFSTGIAAHLHFSALDPEPAARLRVVGSAGAAVFDDAAPDRRLTLFERASVPAVSAAACVAGDVVSPQLPAGDPLRLSCEQFLTSVRSSSNGASACDSARVVDVLDALQRSLPRPAEAVRAEPERTPDLRLVELPAAAP